MSDTHTHTHTHTYTHTHFTNNRYKDISLNKTIIIYL